MAVNLVKGNRVNLTKDGLKKALVGLGWDINRFDGSAAFDLDLVLFECDPNSRIVDDAHFIFYGNPEDPEGAVVHSGDNRTGAGDGDDESAHVDFSKIDPRVARIFIGVTIYDAKANRQNFGMVDNSYIRIVNEETGEEMYRYPLCEDFSEEMSVIFGELYKNGAEWKFKAVGAGYKKELVDFCHEYGVNV